MKERGKGLNFWGRKSRLKLWGWGRISKCRELYTPFYFDINATFRQEDLKARDEFHQRMVAKDKEKQRNVATKSDKRAYEAAAKRLAQVNYVVNE